MFADLGHLRAYPLRRSFHIRPELALLNTIQVWLAIASLHPLPRSQLFELVLGRKSKRRTRKVLGLLVLINDFYCCAKWTIGTVSPRLSYPLLPLGYTLSPRHQLSR